MEINRTPDTEGLNFVEQMSVDMLPAMFTEDGEQTLENLKQAYLGIRNSAMAAARSRAERALFRLYEACRLVLPHKKDLDLPGYAFDNAYYAAVNAEIEACFDKDLAEAEYELALAAVREKDYAAAGAHFRTAAQNGHPAAQYNYGVTVANGETGDAPDALEGAFWYYKSAHSGYEKAMINLAVAYRRGSGVFTSGVLMLYWYAKAAELLYPYGIHNLGLCLANEEVISGNAPVGRRLISAAREPDGESNREFAASVASQVLAILQKHVYNV